MWQDFANEHFHRVQDSSDRLVAISGAPYGYSALVDGDGRNVFALADALRAPGAIKAMHPPFFLLDVDKKNSEIRLLTDVAGYCRTYRMADVNGFCVSNRAIAPHFALLRKPTLSELGWAAEHRHGFMFDELSPFEHVHRNRPGAMILISQDGYEVKHNRAGLDWFRTTGPDAFEGLERLANEVRTLGDYEEIDVAITGGRDSRASAAFAFHHFPQEGRGRTSYPPALEKTIAKELVEKLPMFDRYEDDDLAVRTDGSSLWQGFERKQGQYVPIRDRAIDWAFALEGSGIGSALYNKCPIRTPFHLFDKAHVSFAGNGGELGKAYAYHPSQVSGVFAKNVPEWLSQIATTPAYQRLASHPITSSTRLHFVTKDFDQPLDEIILSNFLDALDSGITGYRFFDYWYLVGRMAGAQTPGSTATAQILPFLVPEYINQGGMDTLERKVECQLNEDMVRHYMPSWAGLPYFDQLQNSVPTSQIRYFRVDEHLWSGRDAEYFTAVLNESPAFDAPYDRARMVETFATADDSGLSPALLNVKAHSLIYRHGVYELAESVGQVVAELRDTRLRRWKEPA